MLHNICTNPVHNYLDFDSLGGMVLRETFPNFDADDILAVLISDLDVPSLLSTAGNAAAASPVEVGTRLHPTAAADGVDGGFVSCSSIPPLADILLLPDAGIPP
jgi:hypothetical protein